VTDGAEDGAPDDAPEEEAAAPVDRVAGAPRTWSRDQEVLHPSRDQLLEVVTALRSQGFLQCLDVAGVDYLTHPGRTDLPPGVEPARFEVVIVLMNHLERRRIRLRVQVPEAEPTCPSITSLHPGAENPEREAWDMYGIHFAGHPGLTRILMPDDWQGHPLRKDYAVGKIPVQFKGATNVR
jgi:NADH-quinone oxidoreductase subunit C